VRIPTFVRTAIVCALAVAATAGAVRARQSTGGVDEVKTIDVVASRFAFAPATIAVVQGDRVRLRVRSTDRAHGIGIKAFRVKALIPHGGDAVTVEFVAGRAGTFDISCSEYCGSGHAAMKGRLIVAARAR
jgi:cytochrome c oxidase subunit 2